MHYYLKYLALYVVTALIFYPVFTYDMFTNSGMLGRCDSRDLTLRDFCIVLTKANIYVLGIICAAFWPITLLAHLMGVA
jgi:hypothetical protein